MIVEEEVRAAAYREQLARRLEFQRFLVARLAGDPAAAAAVKAAWQPVLDARADREGTLGAGGSPGVAGTLVRPRLNQF